MPRVLVRLSGSATGKPAILDGFGDVRGANGVAAGEVGDGPGDLEDAVPGPGREIELAGRLFEQLAAGFVRGAAGIDFGGTEPGIGFVLARLLPLLGDFHPTADSGRGFALRLSGQGVGG